MINQKDYGTACPRTSLSVTQIFASRSEGEPKTPSQEERSYVKRVRALRMRQFLFSRNTKHHRALRQQPRSVPYGTPSCNPRIKTPQALKHSISIYAYTYILPDDRWYYHLLRFPRKQYRVNPCKKFSAPSATSVANENSIICARVWRNQMRRLQRSEILGTQT